ncbi:MAG: DUF4440 domain-containing protein [Saprospiraceae bacterium]|nr:DUF4440 domain-containing protein [Saprospiraceae bacterium]
MKKFAIAGLLLLTIMCSAFAQKKTKKLDLEKAKSEVWQAELDFSALASKEGIMIAFYTNAAEDAVINRGGNVIKGRDAIKAFYDKDNYKTAKLVWTPDFVDIAVSGDLAYTYGKFTFSGTGADGKEIKSEGIFHTVWKKQKDGSWKFVYD